MHPNDPRLKSFVEVADDSHFPIQNLPFGVFSTDDNALPRVGVAIGEQVLDLAILEAAGLLSVAPGTQRVFNAGSLNPFMSLGKSVWQQTRMRLSELLRYDNPTLRDDARLRKDALRPMESVTMHLPIEVAGYTDFYSSKEHATNVGSMFRDPKNALLPNWLHMPIAYNGRASSVVVSGTPIRRPNGQLKQPDADNPLFGPCRKFDFELETAFIIGQGSRLGQPVLIAEAASYIFGMVLLNDWSARDIQQWEYVPLGPFNSKTFATSISPWVVTMDALEPFRVASPMQLPTPLPYLRQPEKSAYDVHLEVRMKPANVAKTTTVSRTNFRHMYWSMEQQLAHHTASGCNLRVGDLMGSGTISGPTSDSYGSLLELTWNGQNPISLANSVTRTFLEDGDEVFMTGWCEAEGCRIGFGHVSGVILPAL